SVTSLERLVTSDFSGFITDVSFAPTGTQAPTITDRSAGAGAVIGWDFTGAPVGLGTLAPGATSDELIVRTNAPAYDLTQIGGVIDGATVPIAVIGPSISVISPEPASLGALMIGSLVVLKRVRRNK